MPAVNPRCLGWIGVLLCCVSGVACAEPIRALYKQGAVHGFASLKTLDGKTIATGECTQTVHGDRVSTRFIFRFRDGSIDDEQTVYEQREFFKLISNHHIQHGPSFPQALDLAINAVTGELTSRAEDGSVKLEHMDLPDDLYNGLFPDLFLNVSPTTPETKIAYLAPGTKPRLVQLSVKPDGSVPFTVGTMRRKANAFTVHVEVGGVAGVIAPLIGKQPTDYHIYLQSGKPPAFIREEGALYIGGPIWRIEQVSPILAR